MYTETLRFMVQQWHCDHLGHCNVQFYMGWAADAAFSLAGRLGLDRDAADRLRLGLVAVRAELDFRGELRGGDLVVAESAIEALGERKLHLRHYFRRAADGSKVLDVRMVVVCMDLERRRATAFPAAFAAAARAHVVAEGSTEPVA
ncbi:MAG TPA: acyl-CoA thioesterase [Vineibacter sp.]|nr:acyl-CoA thioesterase [Vineibacter sp.]